MLLGCSCGRSGEELDNKQPEPPPAFVFGRSADPVKLDPADIDDAESVNTLAQVLEGLVRFQPGSTEVEPCLAVKWIITPDLLTYDFDLRPGVAFHDGTPLTAETAAWSFRRQMDPAHPAHFAEAGFPSWPSFFGMVTAIETPGEMTVRFRLGNPNAYFLAALAAYPAWLISPHGLQTHGSDLVRHPIGTGPYRFREWRPNEAVVFEKYDRYWGPPAAFPRLILRPIPDPAARQLELAAGRIHGLDGLRGAQLSGLRDDRRFVVHRLAGLNLGYLAFSSHAPQWRDPRARLALAQAIDRATLVRLALDGYGVVPDYPLPTALPGLPAPQESPLRHAPQEASEYFRAHPDLAREPVRLAAFSEGRIYFPDPVAAASLIRADLEKAGLPCAVEVRDLKSHLHRVRKGDFELALLGWIGDMPSAESFLTPLLSSAAAVEGSATNISFYRSPAFDRALLELSQTADPTRRADWLQKALACWAADLPLIPLTVGEQIVVLRREVTSFHLSPLGDLYFGPVGWKQ